VTATFAGVAAALHAVQAPPAWKVTPGLLGFAVTSALVIAVILLIRSMVGHLRKVRYSPEPGVPTTGPAADGESGSTGDSPTAG
jgi:hypothetical protein